MSASSFLLFSTSSCPSGVATTNSCAWIILMLVGTVISFSAIGFVCKDPPGSPLRDTSALRAIQLDHPGHELIVCETARHCKPSVIRQDAFQP